MSSHKVFEVQQKTRKEYNDSLNSAIRRIKNERGLNYAVQTYDEIDQLISSTANAPGNSAFAIDIDMDNQEYIIELLEECSKRCRKLSYKEARLDAAWYKDAAIEARKRKEQYAIRLEEKRISEEKDRKQSNIYTFVGILIFIAFLVFCFSN